MSEDSILYDASGQVATVTMNRPDRLNALDTPAWEQLRDALLRADRDHDIRVVILTGAGKAFCSGDDIGDFEFESAGDRSPSELRTAYDELLAEIGEETDWSVTADLTDQPGGGRRPHRRHDSRGTVNGLTPPGQTHHPKGSTATSTRCPLSTRGRRYLCVIA